jgi:hypothetical protein
MRMERWLERKSELPSLIFYVLEACLTHFSYLSKHRKCSCAFSRLTSFGAKSTNSLNFSLLGYNLAVIFYSLLTVTDICFQKKYPYSNTSNTDSGSQRFICCTKKLSEEFYDFGHVQILQCEVWDADEEKNLREPLIYKKF